MLRVEPAVVTGTHFVRVGYAVACGNNHCSLLVNSLCVRHLACQCSLHAIAYEIPSIPMHRNEPFVFAPSLSWRGLTSDATSPPFTATNFGWLRCTEGPSFPFSSNCTILLLVYDFTYLSVC